MPRHCAGIHPWHWHADTAEIAVLKFQALGAQAYHGLPLDVGRHRALHGGGLIVLRPVFPTKNPVLGVRRGADSQVPYYDVG